MFLCLRGITDQLNLGTKPWSLKVDEVTVTLRMPDETEQNEFADCTMWEAVCELQDSNQIISIIDNYVQLEVARSEKSEFGPLSEDGVREQVFKELDMLPRLSERFSDESIKLGKAVDRVIGIIRWRKGAPGPIQQYREFPLEWSLDGNTWTRSGSMKLRRILHTSPVMLNHIEKQETEEYLKNGLQEPVQHELWREANDLQWDGERSAIIIGLSAAETGLKAVFQALGFPPKKKLSGLLSAVRSLTITRAPTLYPITKSVIDQIDKARDSLRNPITHGQAATVQIDYRERLATIAAVRDLLYWCDYCVDPVQNAWALAYLRLDTRVEMGIP